MRSANQLKLQKSQNPVFSVIGFPPVANDNSDTSVLLSNEPLYHFQLIPNGLEKTYFITW